MVTACGQRFNIISFVSFTGPMSEAYFWRGMVVNLQPSGFRLRTKQNLTLICFSRFHMFASKLSINDETACLKTWFSCGRTRSFRHFLESSRSFSFFYPKPFICVNQSLRQSMGELLLKSINILLYSSLRTRAVSCAFLNQCKGA